MRRTFSLFAIIFLIAFARSASAQATADIIRGKIIGPDSQPIVNASINVVSAQGGISKTAKTNKDGRFSVVFPNGEGDYFVYISAIGYSQKKFEVKRIADEEILIADSKLAPAQLETVNVVANAARQAASRNDNTADLSGSTRGVGNGAVSAADAGNLAALAASLPGFQLIPGLDGNPDLFSALGLSPDQNNSSLNGGPGGGLDLPRDAQTTTSVSTGSWDISSGGYSGAQVQIRTSPGNNYKYRIGSFQGDPTPLQWTDDVGNSLSARRSRLSLGGQASGPLKMDRNFYNSSFSIERVGQDAQNLFNTDPYGLTSAGIAADSVARLRTILQGLNIPLGATSIPDGVERYQGRFQGVIDFTPSGASAHAFQFSALANVNFPAMLAPSSFGVYSAPTMNREQKSYAAVLGGRHTMYLWDKVISETWLSGQFNRSSVDAYLAYPQGSVRVGSTLDDGSSAVHALSFGASGQQSSENSGSFIGLKNQLRWVSVNNKHTFKLTSEIRQEATSSDASVNELGSFSFLSLEDLEAGRPSGFSRSLAPIHAEANQISGNLSLGDAWRPTPTFQAQFGVRLDANRFLTTPDYNEAVTNAFGVRNDNVPNRVYPSAVAGFSWQYGQAAQIPYQQGFVTGPRATIMAGVRVTQNIAPAGLISQATAQTGLPGSARTLVCTGPATPVPQWDQYRTNPGSIPGECADGSSPFATSVPSVVMFDPNFNQSRSIRPSVSWSGAVIDNRFRLSANAVHSLNFDQQGFVDLNFDPTERFTLADEGNRPVYVPATAIDTRTGAIASRASRVSQDFNAVRSLRSDLKSTSSQLNFQLNPLNYNQTRFTWGVGYTWQYVRQQYNGFSSTVGNPYDRAWGVSQGPRHAINYNLSYNFFDYVSIGWYGSFISGTRFTPMVSGDVNGDNTFGNDRAFVFDPATANPEVAAGMQSLLDNGSSAARECLRSQIGGLAKRNSCVTPWTIGGSQLNLTIQPIKLKLPPRATINFSISNPLAAFDMLVHGSDNTRGWGQQRNPDQSLLFVRGFDPATQSYKYEVNQRFGSTDAQQIINRNPVVVTASVRLDVGPTRDWQGVKMQLDRGRKAQGNRVTEAQLKSTIMNAVPNPMARILQVDVLGLTRKQADSLAMLSRGFNLTLDSIWTPVARYYGGLDTVYSASDAHERFVRGREAAANYLIKVAPHVKKLLTKSQIRRLAPGLQQLLEPRYLERVRAGTVSVSGIPIFF